MNYLRTLGLIGPVAICAVAVLIPASAIAHATGAIDPYGCHSDRRTGGYHCHRGEYKNVNFRSKADMLSNKKAGKSGTVLRQEEGRDGTAPSILGAVLGTQEETQRTAANSELIVPKGVERRLQILEDLHKQGLITQEEYQTKRAEILGDL